jgi:hypothetical protein
VVFQYKSKNVRRFCRLFVRHEIWAFLCYSLYCRVCAFQVGIAVACWIKMLSYVFFQGKCKDVRQFCKLYVSLKLFSFLLRCLSD